MEIKDFSKDEFYSLRSDCELWGRAATVYVELADNYDVYGALTGYLAIINERTKTLCESRRVALECIISEVTAERLGLDEGKLFELAYISECTVFCDDGAQNVWVNAFVEFGEGYPVVQIEMSPQNEIRLSGVCGENE